MSRCGSNRSRRGIVAIEFALIGAAFFLLLFVIVDIGRLVAARTELRAAVGEVVRAAVADTTGPVCADPKSYALSRVSLLEPDALSVTAVCVTTSVTVTAEYVFTFIMPAFGTAPRTLRAVVSSPV